MLQERLECRNHSTFETKSGHDALKLYEQHPIDLVLLEIFLPDRDGLELIQDIRIKNTQAKIIAMSGGFGQVDMNIVTMANRLGAAQTLSKPFKIDDLLSSVESLLAHTDTGKCTLAEKGLPPNSRD